MSEVFPPPEAHTVRPFWPRPTLTTRIATVIASALRDRRAAEPARQTDEPLDDLIAALATPFRPEGFAMGATVVVSGRMIEPRVWVRVMVEGRLRTWSLNTVEAAVAAIRCRFEAPALIGHRLADAFNHAVTLAERRMDALNAASPTAERP